MNCSNCGTLNNVDSKFCIGCGKNLTEMHSFVGQPVQTVESSFQGGFIQNINDTQIKNTNNLQMNPIGNNVPAVKMSFMGYFFIILAALMRPFSTFNEELNKFNKLKNSIMLSLIVSGIGTLINLITAVFNTVRVKSYDFLSGSYKTTWNWEYLKELDYLQVIGKNFLIYLGAIVAITVVYYIASAIVKKQTHFSRLLGISAIAITPILMCSLVLAPILSLIWTELAIPINIAGGIYTIILIYEGMNSELLVEGNAKYYLNLICFSILGIAAYHLYVKLFMSSISNGFEDIMDMFG